MDKIKIFDKLPKLKRFDSFELTQLLEKYESDLAKLVQNLKKIDGNNKVFFSLLNVEITHFDFREIIEKAQVSDNLIVFFLNYLQNQDLIKRETSRAIYFTWIPEVITAEIKTYKNKNKTQQQKQNNQLNNIGNNQDNSLNIQNGHEEIKQANTDNQSIKQELDNLELHQSMQLQNNDQQYNQSVNQDIIENSTDKQLNQLIDQQQQDKSKDQESQKQNEFQLQNESYINLKGKLLLPSLFHNHLYILALVKNTINNSWACCYFKLPVKIGYIIMQISQNQDQLIFQEDIQTYFQILFNIDLRSFYIQYQSFQHININAPNQYSILQCIYLYYQFIQGVEIEKLNLKQDASLIRDKFLWLLLKLRYSDHINQLKKDGESQTDFTIKPLNYFRIDQKYQYQDAQQQNQLNNQQEQKSIKEKNYSIYGKEKNKSHQNKDQSPSPSPNRPQKGIEVNLQEYFPDILDEITQKKGLKLNVQQNYDSTKEFQINYSSPIIQSALNKKQRNEDLLTSTIVAVRYGFEIKQLQILNFVQQNIVSEDLINFILSYFEEKYIFYNKKGQFKKQLLVMTTQFFFLVNMKLNLNEQITPEQLDQLANQDSSIFSNFEIMFIPMLNKKANEYSLAIVNIQQKQLTYYIINIYDNQTYLSHLQQICNIYQNKLGGDWKIVIGQNSKTGDPRNTSLLMISFIVEIINGSNNLTQINKTMLGNIKMKIYELVTQIGITNDVPFDQADFNQLSL